MTRWITASEFRLALRLIGKQPILSTHDRRRAGHGRRARDRGLHPARCRASRFFAVCQRRPVRAVGRSADAAVVPVPSAGTHEWTPVQSVMLIRTPEVGVATPLIVIGALAAASIAAAWLPAARALSIRPAQALTATERACETRCGRSLEQR